MDSMPRRLCYVVAVGTVALVIGGCSGSNEPTDSKPASSAPAPMSGAEQASKQHYLDAVNALCDKLMPRVVRVTHGGSIDIPARQYLKDWPAHRELLVAFDRSLAAVPVPAVAASAAAAMRNYVTYADSLDNARLKAARQGERAWRAEVAAEKNAAEDSSIAARTAAGFADSCDAR